jgi:hypothetical protein
LYSIQAPQLRSSWIMPFKVDKIFMLGLRKKDAAIDRLLCRHLSWIRKRLQFRSVFKCIYTLPIMLKALYPDSCIDCSLIAF